MAKKKNKTLYKMPNGEYVVKERSYGTKYIQNPKTGLMQGRTEVRGKGDGTRPMRVKKDFTLVKGTKGKRGHKRTYSKGQILGRTKS